VKPKKCSYIVRKCDLKSALLIVVKKLPSISNHRVPFCLIFFSTFIRWWKERFDLPMISILP